MPTSPEPSAPLARLAQMVPSVRLVRLALLEQPAHWAQPALRAPEVRWARLEPLVPRVRWVPPVVSERTALQECWAQLEVSVPKEPPAH